MTDPREVEEPVKQLFSEEELGVRELFNSFYGYLHKASLDDKKSPELPYGPTALTDTSFDRMRHERRIMGFVIGTMLTRRETSVVLQDARIRESRVVQAEELPHMIITSLARIRKTGEWDNSEESRSARKQLVTKGLSEYRNYPLISAAVSLREMLKYDGHEVYAQDVIIASTKWLERVERKKFVILSSSTGDPAA